MTRINLGCGRAQLPTTRENPYTAHLQYLTDTAFDAKERWVNVDRVAIAGVDEVVDLFLYPWVRSSNGNPWNDNTVDEIWASHLIEHIPHEARYAPSASSTHREQGSLDGWYAWFYEAWRILKPDGLLHIVSPLAFSRGGMADPTHTRYVLPQSFSYMVPNPNAPFDYQIAARFEQYGDILARPCEDVMQKVTNGEIPQDAIGEMASKMNNIYDEMYISLRAVKDA